MVVSAFLAELVDGSIFKFELNFEGLWAGENVALVCGNDLRGVRLSCIGDEYVDQFLLAFSFLDENNEVFKVVVEHVGFEIHVGSVFNDIVK